MKDNKKLSQLGEVQYYQMPGSSPQDSVIKSLQESTNAQLEMNTQHGGDDKIKIASFPTSNVSPVNANSVFKSTNETLAKHLENSSFDSNVADPDTLIQDGGKTRRKRRRLRQNKSKRSRTTYKRKRSHKMKRHRKCKTYKKRK